MCIRTRQCTCRKILWKNAVTGVEPAAAGHELLQAKRRDATEACESAVWAVLLADLLPVATEDARWLCVPLPLARAPLR